MWKACFEAGNLKKHREIQQLCISFKSPQKLYPTVRVHCQFSLSPVEGVCTRLQEADNLCINCLLQLKRPADIYWFTASGPYGLAWVKGCYLSRKPMSVKKCKTKSSTILSHRTGFVGAEFPVLVPYLHYLCKYICVYNTENHENGSESIAITHKGILYILENFVNIS